jgi:lysyl-tRNA synthetase class 2
LTYFEPKSSSTEDGLETFSGRVRSNTEDEEALIVELVLLETTIHCNIPSMPGPELGDRIAVRCRKSKDETFEVEEWSILERPISRETTLLCRSDIRNAIEVRREVARLIRQFFDSRGFLEMETSILLPSRDIVPVAHFEMGRESCTPALRICPENQLKRLVAAGYDRVYEIARNFRKEKSDDEHLPEFTSIECYQANANYESMIEIFEELFRFLWKEIKGYNFSESWKRIDFTEASHKLGIDFTKTKTPQELLELLRLKGIGLDLPPETVQWIDVYGKLAEAIEQTLDSPSHLMNHPTETICVAKRHDDRPHLIERFEAFVDGKEIAHGFTELVDPVEQRIRMNELLDAKPVPGSPNHPLDKEFLCAMELMPPMAGLGIGIDRLVMLLTGLPIYETVTFPFNFHPLLK